MMFHDLKLLCEPFQLFCPPLTRLTCSLSKALIFRSLHKLHLYDLHNDESSLGMRSNSPMLFDNQVHFLRFCQFAIIIIIDC